MLLLIGLNNTSNNGQVSKSLNSQLFKKIAADGDVKVPLRESLSANYRILLFLCNHKNMCVNYFYSHGSVCIESSLIVSWAHGLTSLIAVNCRAY